ncbi:MAG: beta-ketoacyl-[acyl-carrier-protein] synthase family protein [Deltaproteobacteria bacterium]|nr:beta-ketoacyl-[acyl-carrier-protein] synthase family protein [Deltaproteobacteria bacterium]
MSQPVPVFVTGIGVVCAGANDVGELRRQLAHPVGRFQIPTVFPVKHPSGELPAAQVVLPAGTDKPDLPRTHHLAFLAARQAVAGGPPPDAIVVGTTTGGIATTEAALEAGIVSPEAYRHHGLDTVALHLADAFAVRGPVLTVSTACSSATVALSIATKLLRAGLAKRVLAGGADCLSRLTFHGFRQLQLVAPEGCMPMDANRTGMTVGEGAGFLVLELGSDERPALAVLSGTGLSCDAHHATRPHPEGTGAALAMRRALADAGLEPAAIGYVNLHGTGTPDNDAAEARAVRQVFAEAQPPLSSTKGLTGHALAAAGGIEAVISILALRDGLLPANIGLTTLDETLDLSPLRVPMTAHVSAVLSNSFGFGGNNACVVFEKAPSPIPPAHGVERGRSPAGDAGVPALRIAAAACLTARGGLDETWAALLAGESPVGLVPDTAFAKAAPAAFVRRLRRLPRLMLALAQTVQSANGRTVPPGAIVAGTAWGPLAETQDFLRKLFESGDQFSSPMDFVGSVHNAPAGQIALLLGCQAPNLTCSAGQRSFGQALLCGSLEIASGADSALVVAAEAFEPKLSPLFEPALAASRLLSDGGAAFLLVPDDNAPGARLRWLGEAADGLVLLDRIIENTPYDAVMLAAPAGQEAKLEPIRSRLARTVSPERIVPYPDRLGQHASIAAAATAIAARAVAAGVLPLAAPPVSLARRRLLLVEIGPRSTVFEVFA